MIKEYMGLVRKNEDGSELVNYNDPAFPAYIYDGNVYKGCTWEKVPHYHEDVEIVSLYSGKMAYSVNGKIIEMKKGDTIFVNSGCVHYSIAPEERLARYIIAVVHPKILCSSYAVEKKAVNPIIHDKSVPYILFKKDDFESDDLMKAMFQLHDKAEGNEFLITKRFFEIWEIIMNRFTDAYRVHIEHMDEVDQHNQSFKDMMQFIAENYDETITLKCIANAGNVGTSLCNQIFNKLTGMAPIEYLMHYRSRKVAELLTSSSLPMGEIARVTGFSGASYMSEVFKRYHNISPREYRKQMREGTRLV